MTLADGVGPSVAHRAGEIDPVEAEDDVDVLQSLDALGRDRARRAGIERMVGRKARADLEIGHHARIERFGERHAGIPGLRIARGAAGENQNLLRPLEHGRRLAHEFGGRRGRDRRHVARDVDLRQLAR